MGHCEKQPLPKGTVKEALSTGDTINMGYCQHGALSTGGTTTRHFLVIEYK